MAKYDFTFKRMVVDAYNNGEGSYRFLCEKYSIPDTKNLRKWVAAFNSLGDEGLMRSRKNQTYSFDFKLHVVELYLSSEVSYQELALLQGINNPALLTKWVNDFRITGPDSLRPKKKGSKKTLESNNKKKQVQSMPNIISVDTSIEHVKQLEDELLKLRIENAYLKELRRLRLEEETLLKKQRESSTASEEISN